MSNTSATQSTSAIPAQRSRIRYRPLWLLVAGLLLILLWLGLKGWRTYQAVQSLRGRQAEVESLLAEGIAQADPDAVETAVMAIRQDVVTIKQETAVFMPLTPYLGWLPRVGALMPSAPHLLEMADAGTEAAAYAVRGLKPALVLLQNDQIAGADRLPALVDILATANPDLRQASQAFDRLMAARMQLGNPPGLPWAAQTLLTQADDLLPLANDGLKLAQVLPGILGHETPRRYLIIAQNEDEMRPTGGFITGAGQLLVDNGRIVELSFQDANFVDNWQEKPYGFPPQPLYELMGLELFLFRDANFWPNFPTSAEQAMALYTYGQDSPPLDGAIAIDQRFMQLLVEVTGPVPVPGSPAVIDSSNVIDAFRAARDIQEGQTVHDWVHDRKAFLNVFAGAIRTRLEQDFAAIDPVYLARNMQTAVAGKHLQLYMRDPAAAAVLHAISWDGHLPLAGEQDYLLVVDTNVGYNKANVFIERALSYRVTLSREALPLADLTIHYTHTAPPNDRPCYQGVAEEYQNAEEYLVIADQCYWNYLRIYAPPGSQLRQATTHLVPGSALFSGVDWQQPAQTITEFQELTTFSNFLLVPRGQTVSSHYQYTLSPAVIQGDGLVQRYQLRLIKPAGWQPQPLTLTVNLPAGTQLVAASLEPTAAVGPTAVDGQTITFTTQLEQDSLFVVTYR